MNARSVALALSFAWATACVDGSGKPETGDTGVLCPYDLASFCRYEFGGACPTYDEAGAMTCDDDQFDPSASTGESPRLGDGNEDCPSPTVGCKRQSDPNIRTLLFFTATGNGTLRGAYLVWDGECPSIDMIGDPGSGC